MCLTFTAGKELQLLLLPRVHRRCPRRDEQQALHGQQRHGPCLVRREARDQRHETSQLGR